MPTGYTSYIGQGCDFETFAMKCAHAFGACIDMRDGSLDAQIPDSFEPSKYHLEEKCAAERKFKKISKFKKSDWEKLFKKESQKEVLRYKKYLSEAESLLAKYNAMLEKVTAWIPPTEEHQRFKTFMIEQIESSISFDCDLDYWRGVLKGATQKASSREWSIFKNEEIARVLKDISYHETEYQEEVDRARKNSEWVKALRDSLV